MLNKETKNDTTVLHWTIVIQSLQFYIVNVVNTLLEFHKLLLVCYVNQLMVHDFEVVLLVYTVQFVMV